MSFGSATIASTRSFSSMWPRISDGPEPAPPLNSGEPFRTMPALPPRPVSSTSRIFEATCSRNSIAASPTAGSPGETPLTTTGVLCLHVRLDGLPVGPEGWVREDVVELAVLEPVHDERVALTDIGRVLTGDQQVGLADRVGALVDLLPEQRRRRVRAEAAQVLVGNAEHAAGADRRVVEDRK